MFALALGAHGVVREHGEALFEPVERVRLLYRAGGLLGICAARGGGCGKPARAQGPKSPASPKDREPGMQSSKDNLLAEICRQTYETLTCHFGPYYTVLLLYSYCTVLSSPAYVSQWGTPNQYGTVCMRLFLT